MLPPQPRWLSRVPLDAANTRGCRFDLTELDENGWLRFCEDHQRAAGYPIGFSCCKAKTHGPVAIRALMGIAVMAAVSKVFRHYVRALFAMPEYEPLLYGSPAPPAHRPDCLLVACVPNNDVDLATYP